MMNTNLGAKKTKGLSLFVFRNYTLTNCNSSKYRINRLELVLKYKIPLRIKRAAPVPFTAHGKLKMGGFHGNSA